MTENKKMELKEKLEFALDDIYTLQGKWTYEEIVEKILMPILETALQEKREKVLDKAMIKFSDKPPCTEKDPCGCHFGEVFHADGQCACDIKKEILQSLSIPKTEGGKE